MAGLLSGFRGLTALASGADSNNISQMFWGRRRQNAGKRRCVFTFILEGGRRSGTGSKATIPLRMVVGEVLGVVCFLQNYR